LIVAQTRPSIGYHVEIRRAGMKKLTALDGHAVLILPYD
jgi:hypothetical protein